MSLFLNKDKTRKSPIVMTSFLLAIAFALVYGGCYMLLTVPLHQHVSLGSPAVTNALHLLLIALAGTAVCCLLFLLRDKRLVPYAFAGLAVILAAFYIAALLLPEGRRGLMLYVISLYGLGPVLVGNAASWAAYLALRRRRACK